MMPYMMYKTNVTHNNRKIKNIFINDEKDYDGPG
jgi:hypothetical protein